MKKEYKNLDELFREKLNSDDHPFIFNKDDWDELVQMLGRFEKSRRNLTLFRTLTGVAAALLIFFSIGYLMMKDQQVLKLPPTARLEKDTKNGSRGMQEEKSIDTKNEEVSTFNGLVNMGRNKMSLTPKTDVGVILSRSEIAEDLTTSMILGFNKPFDEAVNQLTYQLPAKKGIQQHDGGVIDIPVVQSKEDDRHKMDERRKVVLSVLAAPAFNGVGGFKNGKIGSDFGFLVSVDLTKRLSVSTGAVYAKKLYDADFNRNLNTNIGGYGNTGYGYNNSADYGGIFPEEVYADCRVLDIPLNINYSIIEKGKNKLSVGTGMSSYIMLRETYRFEYAEQTGIYDETLDLKNENKHFMNIVNFQASYTRKINPNVSVSLQPYVKIPVADIGYAKVKLQSVGMAVNVNFTLNPNKK